ncbi:MAG: Trk system potassium transporter TrkA [Clostridiales bacterium]|nr:Trk system potassium transporter TrkA [Clostridiales bacterium]
MNLIIVGVGKVGETLVENLIKEEHDVMVIDVDAMKVSSVVNRFDVNGVTGNAIERNVLLSAGVDKADFVIACTNRDEMNVLCCVLARKLGAKRTIARVRDPEYFKEMDNMKEDLGLDYFFNPELNTAIEISQVLKFPSAINVESFAGGRANMVEFFISEDNPIVGKTLSTISKEYGNNVLVGTIQRGNDVIIPHGDSVIKKNDVVYIIGDEAEISLFAKKIKMYKRKIKTALIIGGGKVGYYLAKELASSNINVKVIEKEKQRAQELSEALPYSTVILGDGTDEIVLAEEGLKNTDACITLTGMDEENVIVALYATQQGVEKVVAKVDRPSVLGMVKKLGLDTAVSPRLVIANHIVRFVRAHQSDNANNIATLYKLHDKVEAIEFTVSDTFVGVNTPIKNLKIKRGILIGGIVRDEKFILPSGDTKFRKGDRVIVVTAIKQITALTQILK